MVVGSIPSHRLCILLASSSSRLFVPRFEGPESHESIADCAHETTKPGAVLRRKFWFREMIVVRSLASLDACLCVCQLTQLDDLEPRCGVWVLVGGSLSRCSSLRPSKGIDSLPKKKKGPRKRLSWTRYHLRAGRPRVYDRECVDRLRARFHCHLFSLCDSVCVCVSDVGWSSNSDCRRRPVLPCADSNLRLFRFLLLSFPAAES